MAEGKATGTFLGAGGCLFEDMIIPDEGTHARERFDEQVARGDLTRVEAPKKAAPVAKSSTPA